MLIRKTNTHSTKIIFKKGNKKHIKNDRLTCLLSNIYKVLTKFNEKTLDENQPPEPAGFKSR